MSVTRADVARRAGVSPALVSYVINDGPRSVSDAARARIEKAIAELDYRPNSIAQALRGASTRTVGLLLPSAVNRFFGELTTAIEKELFDVGHTLAVGVSGDDPEREARYIDTFLDRRVDGIMVISSHSRETLARVAQRPTPAVVLDRVASNLSVSSVSVDNRAGVFAAVAHLRSHGHIDGIACIGGRALTESAEERVDAWREAVSVGAPERDGLLVRGDFTERGGYDAAMQLLSGPTRDRPRAIFISSDIQTDGALRACAQLGIRVPEDLAVVSFDGTLGAAYSVPSITSFRQPTASIAQHAVQGLLDRIASPAHPAAHTVLPGELIIGSSCGCPPSAATPLPD